MGVYDGVVHGNRIELEGGVRLAEGLRLEVHAPPAADRAADEAATGGLVGEEVVLERLRAAGLLAPATAGADGTADEEEFEPVVVRGEPLSEQIIRERR